MVRNDDGTPSALVHMWDRFPMRYASNFSVLDEESELSKVAHARLHAQVRASMKAKRVTASFRDRAVS